MCKKETSENSVHETNCNYLPNVTLLFSVSSNNAIDFFMNTQDNCDIDSFLGEDDHEETDMESDASDDMNDGLAHHFPRP